MLTALYPLRSGPRTPKTLHGQSIEGTPGKQRKGEGGAKDIPGKYMKKGGRKQGFWPRMRGTKYRKGWRCARVHHIPPTPRCVPGERGSKGRGEGHDCMRSNRLGPLRRPQLTSLLLFTMSFIVESITDVSPIFKLSAHAIFKLSAHVRCIWMLSEIQARGGLRTPREGERGCVSGGREWCSCGYSWKLPAPPSTVGGWAGGRCHHLQSLVFGLEWGPSPTHFGEFFV